MLTFTSKTTTLLYLTLVLAATAVVEAHDSPIHRRDHVHLNRMIRKRTPQEDEGPVFTPVIGAVPRPPTSTDSDAESASTSASASVSDSASASASVSASISASVSASASASESASRSASESASVSSSSSEERPLPSRSVVEEPPRPTAPEAESSPPVAAPTSSSGPPVTNAKGPSTKTVNVEVDPTAPPSMAGAAREDQNKSNIMTILIAVAASVGGVFILWTVFRKWKLGSSRKFDKRMQPIETTWDDKPSRLDDAIAARRLSGSSQNSGRHSARKNPLNPLPDHDFTAGPAHSSPVGGYADLSRGPSFNYSGGYNGNGTRY